ncbi:PSD1 and planctomycete cytochrome C domain-containing protein [Pirellula sp. SH-Sr6A]|uniref:PSD1 and planctomycete cytochrome C domain-containing protein n=1 Tax=Pirellula sp. SH-Sr6A TaxID=1632865 RepID=UPI00197B3C34|nr:PSD1 and planctomycete cytochrome C domain-containing protein [Pirellula sp. SH-Sr6A]
MFRIAIEHRTLVCFVAGLIVSWIPSAQAQQQSAQQQSGQQQSGPQQPAQLQPAQLQTVEFNRDIRPILSDNCFFCHGPDANRREADLRLDRAEDAYLSSIVPGDAKASELVSRIFSEDADEKMPPPESHKTLTEAQKDLLKRWVEQGAVYQKHWAYEPPKKSAIPPGVHPIDHLVNLKLTEQDIAPTKAADRRILIRRLYFDLLGYPPSPEQVKAFVEAEAPNAYEQLVDSILNSPHYGERMAIGWLDVVRFADTIGYHSDNPRNIWPYRDYVIQSFNSNKPFDRFTIEQIAGDLLPDANQETKVASAFNRLLLSTEEGGSQPKDYEQRMLTDRVRAIGAVWLGQTTGCAQCHDHKFDPITMRDFYSLGAFFADIQEPIIGAREPGMMVMTDEQSRQWEEAQRELDRLQRELDAPHPELDAEMHRWEGDQVARLQRDETWSTVRPTKVQSVKKNINLRLDKDGNVLAKVDEKRVTRSQSDGTDTYILELPGSSEPTTGLRLDVIPEGPKGIGLAPNGNFVLSEITAEVDGKSLDIEKATATYEQPNFPAAHAVDGISDRRDNGWAVLGGEKAVQSLYLQWKSPQVAKTGNWTIKLVFGWGGEHAIAKLRIQSTSQPPPIESPNSSSVSPALAKILLTPAADRTEGQKKELVQGFKESTESLRELRTKLSEAKKRKSDLENTFPKCLVSISSPSKRTVRILPRGNWMDESGEVVQPAFPAYLPQPPAVEGGYNRLDLAKWLVSSENPLTARTVMNRLWKQLFGAGLSKVLDDLGAQGETPPNLPLLDQLACEFVERGWDMKHMVRFIVTSETYRRSSNATPVQLERDPDNRFWGRQTPFRIDAELVRDTALRISGLLVQKVGGPSVKPYQPEGYWENLNFPVRKYQPDSGNNQYRRGLYTWWQRSFVHPSMLAFDAPTREECAADRNRSNIPQQALVLLNDPSYVEAACAFAEKILRADSSGLEDRIRLAWQLTLQRDPTHSEYDALRAVINDRVKSYSERDNDAKTLITSGHRDVPEDLDRIQLAAWTHVCRILLNLHETITRP